MGVIYIWRIVLADMHRPAAPPGGWGKQVPGSPPGTLNPPNPDVRKQYIPLPIPQRQTKGYAWYQSAPGHLLRAPAMAGTAGILGPPATPGVKPRPPASAHGSMMGMHEFMLAMTWHDVIMHTVYGAPSRSSYLGEVRFRA